MRRQNLIIAVITALVACQLDSSWALQCYNCVSTGNDNCITNASSQPTVDCPSNNCFTSTDGKGLVTRGCLPAGSATCPDATNCPTCNTDKCNTNNVCYNCNGEACNTVTANMLTACAGDSKCYTTGTSATNMTRGCTADTTATYKCPADSTDPTCAICATGQCNNLTFSRTDGKCIVCTECAGLQDTSKTADCTVQYNQPTGCYSTTAGSRGCLAGLEGGCTDANSCKSCTGDNCNTAGQEFQCIACLSSEVAGCWEGSVKEGTLPTVPCTNGTCFSGVWNGLGVRDCLTAGSELMQYQCVNHIEPYQCTTCNTASLCNNVKFNGAGSLSQSVGVVGLLLGLLVVLRSA